MSHPFHIILLILFFPNIYSLPLLLSTSTQIQINSSYSSDSFQLIIQAAANKGQSFQMFSEALSPVEGIHTLTMKDNKFDIRPYMGEETIVMNTFHKGKYYLAFHHPLKKQKKESVFLPMQLIEGEKTYELLMAGLTMPLSFMSEDSFYRCENLLISVQHRDTRVQLNLFALENKNKMWSINGKWDKIWRHSDSGLHYGQAVRTNSDLNIDISTKDGRVCLMDEQTLARKNEKILDPKKYYNFDDIWKWAIEVKSSQRQTLQDL